LSAWGENLIASSPDDGKVYEWALNTGSAAAVLSNAPTGVVSIIVSDERFLFAFKPREVHWSDQENNNTWTASATNQAGDIKLETQGSIKCAEKIRGGILIITDQDAHTCTYIGQPFVHSIQRVGDGCGIFSSQASTTINAGVVWMGDSGFHLYSGGRVQELKCDVTDHIFNEMSMSQKSKVACVANSKFDEVIWYYPSDSGENEKYVSWNYKNNSWSIGTLGRTCGIDAGVFSQPIYATAKNHDNNFARGRITFEKDYGGTPPLPDVNMLEVGKTIKQKLDILTTPGEQHQPSTYRTWYNTHETKNLLDSSAHSVDLGYFSYLVKHASGTEYETYTFPECHLRIWARQLNHADWVNDFTLTITGLDENGVAQTETISVSSTGFSTPYADQVFPTWIDYYATNGTAWMRTTKKWTKISANGLRVTRPGSSSGGSFTASDSSEQFSLGISLDLPSYDLPNHTGNPFLKNLAEGTVKGSYANKNDGASPGRRHKTVDVEVTQGTFLTDALVVFLSSGHPISSFNTSYITGFLEQALLTPSEYMLVEHEIGEERDSLVPYAESGAIQIGNGDQVMHVNQVIPDEKTQGQVNVDFKTRFYPNGSETTHGTYTLANPTSVRFQGREVRMKIKNVSGDWRVGNFRLNAMAGGKR
jgi:hypothetical protein